jgi:hypothetical protein
MKNIHILPTEKPSRLFEILNFNYIFDSQNKYSDEYKKLHKWRAKNIYITSDEEIKDGDWCIDDIGEVFKIEGLEYFKQFCNKIILTTDQDLIKDGVQAIDDEFLKWFVKNPSCEWVKVEHERVLWENGEITHYKYKIIIPKEVLNSISSKNIPSEFNDIVNKEFFNLIEEPKQETLEEALNKFVRTMLLDQSVYIDFLQCAEFGAKWQQEQDKNKFSEEDIKLAFESGKSIAKGCYTQNQRDTSFKEWFEQNKKK